MGCQNQHTILYEHKAYMNKQFMVNSKHLSTLINQVVFHSKNDKQTVLFLNASDRMGCMHRSMNKTR